MLNPAALFLGFVLTGGEAPREDPVCWIDPLTGRPYLARCEKARKQPRSPVVEKADTLRDARTPAGKPEE